MIKIFKLMKFKKKLDFNIKDKILKSNQIKKEIEFLIVLIIKNQIYYMKLKIYKKLMSNKVIFMMIFLYQEQKINQIFIDL